MEKIINGKRYNTETAQYIGTGSSRYPVNDFNYWEEELYLKRTGEFFLYGWGNAASKYSQSVGQNSWTGGEKIQPLSYDTARKWAEEFLEVEDYEKYFEVEPEDTVRQSVVMPVALNDRLRKAAEVKGISISRVVNYAVEKYLEELDQVTKYFVVVDDMARGGDAFRIEGEFDNLEDAILEAKWYWNDHLVERERKNTEVFVATDIINDEEQGIFEWRTVWSARD